MTDWASYLQMITSPLHTDLYWKIFLHRASVWSLASNKQTSAIHLLTQPPGSYSPLKKHLLLTKHIYTQDLYLITCFNQTSAHVVSWFLHLLPVIQLPTQPHGSCSPIRHLATICFWPNWLVPRLVLLSISVHFITTSIFVDWSCHIWWYSSWNFCGN